MSDNTSDQGKKETTLTLKPRLELTKAVDGGQIRQNFSHGRSKTVTVVMKKRRTFVPGESNKAQEENNAPAVAEENKEKLVAGTENKGNRLTNDERTARLRALKQAEVEAAIVQEQEEEAKKLQIEANKRAEEERAAAEKAAAEKPQETPVAGESVKAVENPAPQPQTVRSTPVAVEKPKVEMAPPRHRAEEAAEDEFEANKKGTSSKIVKAAPRVGIAEVKKAVKPEGGKSRWEDSRRSSGKINVNSSFETEEERVRSLASLKRAREKARRLEYGPRETEKIIREVTIPETITVQELAGRMAERGTDVVRELMKLGMIVTINQTVDADTAELIVHSFGHKFKRVTEGDVENILINDEDMAESLVRRAPVVTVMGHVDHGKTSLLDALRSTDVAAGEAGGITQHIGAYQIELEGGQHITFLDTPGHEAFTAMRSRGAKATDIVILVVAADDGIMAQTIEAINHAKAAEVPIIVALNKIDKPNADPDRVRNELLTHGLVSEELGGETIVVEVSAKKRINLDKLEEVVLLQAEMLDLKANPDRAATGVVIESKIDKGKGPVATVLVQKGTLAIGDIIVAGTAWGRVRALSDDKAHTLDKALPSMPVEIIGFSSTPDAGDVFAVVETEKQAREIAEYRERRSRTLRTAATHRGSLEELFSKASASGKTKELPLIIKADVQGSVEAITASITKFPTDEIKVRVLHAAPGGITESDIALAQASHAIVLGFNVRANPQARDTASKEGVDIRYYSVIYDLIDDVKAALSGMLSPVLREEYLGTAEIRQVFVMSKFGKVAGAYVQNGIIRRGAHVRLLRDNIVIHQGKLKTLKRFKDDVKEVKDNFECGMAFENYDDIRAGDMVEAYEIIEERQTL